MESFRDFVSDNLSFCYVLAVAFAIVLSGLLLHIDNIRMGKIIAKGGSITFVDDDDENPT